MVFHHTHEIKHNCNWELVDRITLRLRGNVCSWICRNSTCFPSYWQDPTIWNNDTRYTSGGQLPWQVCDFGLALAVDEGSSQKDDLEVKGTFGYVAPEYLMDGECLKYHMALPYNRHPTDKYTILRSAGNRMHIIRSMTSAIAYL